ncbi:MAG: ATP-dependent sacrificial sulfur transferase LarE [Thermoplasmata archaeon]|nr:ATP-dependent sacrificial sulfur transferase LarE [Thermoplasmata archaeon]
MKKYREIVEKIKSKGNLLVAFSGGADSSLVAKAAVDAGVRAVAVMINSPLIPGRELEHAARIADEIGIEFVVVDKKLDEKVAKNDENRCFYCRLEDARLLTEFAKKNGFDVVADGINYDDEYAGKKAMDIYGVWHPLIEFEVGSNEAREMLRAMNISSWKKKPESCLATRIYGRITEDELKMVEKAENAILKYVDFVRVRKYGDEARIEVMEDIEKLIEFRGEIVKNLRKLGFKKIYIDAEGYKKQK